MSFPGLKELVTIALVLGAFAALWRLAQRKRRPKVAGVGSDSGPSPEPPLRDGPTV
jgi:hypothetical protein